MKTLFRTIFALLVICVVTSCKDDGYTYPSVKLEFLTATVNGSGVVHRVLTDRGETLSVSENKSTIKLESNSTQRIIANIEQHDDNTAVIYSLATTISGMPLSVDAPEFEKGIITHPVEVLSSWQGNFYLNMVLLIKTQDSQHQLSFVEESSELNDEGEKCVRVLLYHDSGSDTPKYNTKRAYASIPVAQYLDDQTQSVKLYFKYRADNGDFIENGPYLFQKDI